MFRYNLISPAEDHSYNSPYSSSLALDRISSMPDVKTTTRTEKTVVSADGTGTRTTRSEHSQQQNYGATTNLHMDTSDYR